MRPARSLLAAALISPGLANLHRGWHETRRRALSQPHTVVFYHRVTDAWSWLLAQQLSRLVEEYDIALRIRVLAGLPIDCVPDPARLDDYAAYDAMRLARAWSLQFPDAATPPAAPLSHLADRVILGQPRTLARLLAATAAAWQGDQERLAAMAAAFGACDERTAARLQAEHGRELRRRGHYLGATLWYQGEWFWGLDRLELLEARLRARGLHRREGTLTGRTFRPLQRGAAGTAQPLDMDFFFSFRSPYSYLGSAAAADLADRLGLRLVLRPLLPMVQRGEPVPVRKLCYILRDAARIARLRKVPFGPVRDPLGAGVERCLAVFHHADKHGAGRAFMLSAMRAIWSEAADLTQDATLYRLAAGCGIERDAVDAALKSPQWRARVEGNAAALAVLGLWGVPSACLRGPDDRPVTIAWGQDRLWAIERAALGVDVAMPPPRLVQ